MKTLILKSMAALACISTGMISAVAQLAPVNLIQNGDFSDPADLTFPYPGYAPTVNSIPGFTASNTNVGVDHPGNSAFSPNFYAGQDFGFIQNTGTLTQGGIHLTAGDSYTFSFLGAARSENLPIPTVTINDGATPIAIPFALEFPNYVTNGFTEFSLTFTATTTTSSGTLVFANTEDPARGDDTFDFTGISLVDNRAVFAPEPATYALLGIGALALVLIRRRTASQS